jgi:hypothetical protein
MYVTVYLRIALPFSSSLIFLPHQVPHICMYDVYTYIHTHTPTLTDICIYIHACTSFYRQPRCINVLASVLCTSTQFLCWSCFQTAVFTRVHVHAAVYANLHLSCMSPRRHVHSRTYVYARVYTVSAYLYLSCRSLQKRVPTPWSRTTAYASLCLYPHTAQGQTPRFRPEGNMGMG